METPFARVIEALDGVEQLAASGAWSAAKVRVRELERALARWFDARGHTDASSVEQLWMLFARLRSAVERNDRVGLPASVDDLRVEVAAIEAGASVVPAPSAP